MKTLAREVKANGEPLCSIAIIVPLMGTDRYGFAKPHYEEMLTLADIVFMNEKDAIYVLGMETTREDRNEQPQELIPKVARSIILRLRRVPTARSTGITPILCKAISTRMERFIFPKR